METENENESKKKKTADALILIDNFYPKASYDRSLWSILNRLVGVRHLVPLFTWQVFLASEKCREHFRVGTKLKDVQYVSHSGSRECTHKHIINDITDGHRYLLNTWNNLTIAF